MDQMDVQEPATKLITNNQRGVTLVELLIVLVVMAVVSGIVALNIAPSTSAAERHAQTIAGAIGAAHDRAVVTGIPHALIEGEGAVTVSHFFDGGWVPVRRVDHLEDVQVTIIADGNFFLPEDTRDAPTLVLNGVRYDEAVSTPPNVFIEPTGSAVPARLVIEDQSDRWTVALSAVGLVEVRHE